MTSSDERLSVALNALFANNVAYRPGTLVRELKRKGFRSDQIRSAVWRMVDANQLTLNENRQFQATNRASRMTTSQYGSRQEG